MNGAARFRLRGVAAGYPGRPDVLRGLDLDIPPGATVALLGENGSGKSTLLKLLARLLPSRAGELHFEGRPFGELSRREAACALSYLPQSFEPLFSATALELTLLGRIPRSRLMGGFSRADAEAAESALGELDATHLLHADIREMSGGERQRVLLARALCGAGRVLLLDEPTGNLDPRHRFLVADVLGRRAAAGASVVLSTHELDVAARADHAVLLADGAALAAGPVRDVLTAPLLARVFGVAAHVSSLPDGRTMVALGGPSPAE